MLNLIVNRDKIKETYLSANDTNFRIVFSSSDWYRMYKKAIFLVGDDSYIVEGLENNQIYPLPEACVGAEFSVYIVGEMANEFKSTEILLVRLMGGGSSGVSEEYALKAIYGDTTVSMGRKANTRTGIESFAFGHEVEASGNYSHAEGERTKALNEHCHAEGYNTTANGYCCHAEGYNTTAFENYSHAEGYNVTANGPYSHAEGYSTKVEASGNYAHAEGKNTIAKGSSSHAEGEGAKANRNCCHAEGKIQ